MKQLTANVSAFILKLLEIEAEFECSKDVVLIKKGYYFQAISFQEINNLKDPFDRAVYSWNRVCYDYSLLTDLEK